MIEGMDRGRKEGKKEGLIEGRKEERIAMAKKFKAMGVDLDTIAKASELSIEEVKAL